MGPSGCPNATDGLPYPSRASLAALAVPLILLTVSGNALVIVAALTSRALRAPQNLFLVSLAAADVLVATLVMPFSLANELMGYWYFGRAWCEVYLALDVLFCTASIAHLCAISLDRYWSVTRAVEHNLKRTPRRVKRAVLAVWVVAGVVSFPPLVTVEKETEREEGRPLCKINDDKWYVVSSCVGSFFLPCFVTVLVYVRIYRIAKSRTEARGRKENEGPRKRDVVEKEDEGDGERREKLVGEPAGRNGGAAAGRRRHKDRRNREKRFTFVLAVVVGVFVICWFPFFFTYTLTALCDTCCVPPTLFKFFFWFGYCNSSLNPIIYTVFNRDFRRAFKKILCRGKRGLA